MTPFFNNSGADPRGYVRTGVPHASASINTKPKGSGTGLGLSIVHTIMRTDEGAIDLDSAPGRGTPISCFFPALAPAAPRDISP